MNDQQSSLSRIQEILNKGEKGSILLPTHPSFDTIASATALYLSLSKMGKTITLACATAIDKNLTNSLSGADKIQSNLITGGDSLVISFPYTDGAIDKVDYNIQGESFNLIITPRSGYKKLDPSQVTYSYTGGTVDFFIVIDAPTLNSLGPLYTNNQNQFVGHEIINIDRHLTNAFFGTVNFVDKTSSSTSELILTLLQYLGIQIDKEAATNLYAGMIEATNNFSSHSVNAETFEHAAQLLKAGAIKRLVRRREIKFSPSPFPSEIDSAKPIKEVEKESKAEEKNPQDWLKPKIFKGGGFI